MLMIDADYNMMRRSGEKVKEWWTLVTGSEDKAPSSKITKTKSVSLQYQRHEDALLTFTKKGKLENGKGRETASRHLQSQNKNNDSNTEEDEGNMDTESDTSEDKGKLTTVTES